MIDFPRIFLLLDPDRCNLARDRHEVFPELEQLLRNALPRPGSKQSRFSGYGRYDRPEKGRLIFLRIGRPIRTI